MARKRERTRIVTVYYGHHVGDMKMWETIPVKIPANTPEDKIEEVACASALPILGNGELQLAFIGLYNESEFCDEDNEDGHAVDP
jgi:hypothetical protein